MPEIASKRFFPKERLAPDEGGIVTIEALAGSGKTETGRALNRTMVDWPHERRSAPIFLLHREKVYAAVFSVLRYLMGNARRMVHMAFFRHRHGIEVVIESDQTVLPRTSGESNKKDSVINNNNERIGINRDFAMLQQLKRSQGVFPVSVMIGPLSDIKLFLGLRVLS